MKLSIITVNLNNADGLRRTIESVISQTFTDYEYIIIDGGSTDSSVVVIKEYEEKINYWVNEPDNGIYNAMNKGILQAKGEYCLFLNSGDWLLKENILSRIFSTEHSEDLICCKLLNHCDYLHGLIQLPKEKLTFYDFFTLSLSHPSTFIKTKLLIKNGMYDETLKIVADWKFFTEAVIIHNCNYITLDIEISGFASGGISTTNSDINIIEREKVLNDHFSPFIEDYKLLLIYKTSRFVKLWKKMKDNRMVLSISQLLLNKKS